jgi:hypothetical protein
LVIVGITRGQQGLPKAAVKDKRRLLRKLEDQVRHCVARGGPVVPPAAPGVLT